MFKVERTHRITVPNDPTLSTALEAILRGGQCARRAEKFEIACRKDVDVGFGDEDHFTCLILAVSKYLCRSRESVPGLNACLANRPRPACVTRMSTEEGKDL